MRSTPIRLNGGDGGSRTHVQNGLKQISTSVDFVFAHLTPSKINLVSLGKAVYSDTHFEKSLDTLNSHPRTATCVVFPSIRQAGNYGRTLRS